jgi:hypothetical protein
VLPATEKTYSDTEVWNPSLSIAPMKLTGVKSYHTIALNRHADSDAVGVFSQVVTAVAVAPQLMSFSAAMYAPDPTEHTGDEPAMVDFGLTGFLITAIPRTPLSTTAVQLLQLLFQESHTTGFRYTSQQVSKAFTVTSAISETGNPPISVLTIAIAGGYTASLKNTGFVLSSLADLWVASQRTAILTDLLNNGFGTLTPSEVNLKTMSESTALNDWPGVALLGSV